CGTKGYYSFHEQPCFSIKRTFNSDVKKIDNNNNEYEGICQSDGYYCVNDGEHNDQFYMCSDSFKGFLKCPRGTKCGNVLNNPCHTNPCVNIQEE
ncbi:Cyst wall-specific glycoprotein Jacob family protein, partial [Entamoeba invadens IP1]|uniref:Cyst wall-specific glycoprotein Jacob family protein n=1 Tax=Entamoeba invadens IP1 TaxID=370355 RepID=UPI0002C3EBC3